MLNVINDSNNPYFNLALEEYFLKHKDIKEDILILWQNHNTIVVGKNQNTYEELNPEYVEANSINVVRRLSGGGAVYHDMGNLNFTIIQPDSNTHKNDFSFFTKPIISCLVKLGANAAFSGRNDIVVDGKKISGNSQYFCKDKLLHHGTLLFNSDLTVLSKALKVKKEKFESKGVKSVASRVTNIGECIDKNISMKEFKDMLVESVFEYRKGEIKNYDLTAEDIENINALVKSKYGTWEWNYGSSPEFGYNKEMRFDAGSVSIKVNVTDGVITELKIYGDFFEEKPVNELEKVFANKRFDIVELKNVMGDIDISSYIHNLDNESFMELFK